MIEDCYILRRINLSGVRIIGKWAFDNSTQLESVEFGNKLETIGESALADTSLRNIKLPKVRFIENRAFANCQQLTEVKLSRDLLTIGDWAFCECSSLRRIALPLKDNLLGDHVFYECEDLSQVDIVGGIHDTISSLLLDSWRNHMNDEIDRINRELPNTHHSNKTAAIQRWMERVLERMEQFKREHYALLKEDMTLLELTLWKANLPNIDAAARHNARVTCGANIIIPHVLSFLNDGDVFPLLNQSV